MTSRVRFEEEADAEVRFAARWYEEHREHLGIEFLDAVDVTIKQIIALPDAGSLVPQMPADLPVRRRAVSRFPYHVIYLQMGREQIRVLAVAHDRRKPGYWTARLT